MKYISLLLVVCTFGCSQSDQVLPKVKIGELRTHFTELLKDYDSTAKLDSFRVIRLDTLNQKQLYYTLLGKLYDAREEDGRLFDLYLPIYKSKTNIVRLSSGLSSSLYRTYKDEADDEHDKLKSLLDNDSLLTMDIDTLKKIIDKSDSIKPSIYQAICLYQLKRKDMSVKKDTGYIFLNRDLNIVSRDDYELQLLNMYKPKGDIHKKYD